MKVKELINLNYYKNYTMSKACIVYNSSNPDAFYTSFLITKDLENKRAYLKGITFSPVQIYYIPLEVHETLASDWDNIIEILEKNAVSVLYILGVHCGLETSKKLHYLQLKTMMIYSCGVFPYKLINNHIFYIRTNASFSTAYTRYSKSYKTAENAPCMLSNIPSLSDIMFEEALSFIAMPKYKAIEEFMAGKTKKNVINFQGIILLQPDYTTIQAIFERKDSAMVVKNAIETLENINNKCKIAKYFQVDNFWICMINSCDKLIYATTYKEMLKKEFVEFDKFVVIAWWQEDGKNRVRFYYQTPSLINRFLNTEHKTCLCNIHNEYIYESSFLPNLLESV